MWKIAGQGQLKLHLATIALILVAVGLVFYLGRGKPAKAPEDLLPPLAKEPTTVHSLTRTDQLKSKCLPLYQQLFEDGVLTIRILFGYKDARPARYVGDRYERAIFTQYVLGPCRKNFHACGFSRDKKDADRFYKRVKDPAGRMATVELMMVHSSVGPDDEENRERDSMQTWQSEYAERAFLEGLREADVVFYDGHSRDGGGPDFFPPKLRSNDHVDYYWYMVKKPGLRKMEEVLSESEAKSKLVGIFSCVSDKHFSGKVRKANPSIGLITTPKLIYYTEALRNMIGALSGVIGQFCENDFRSAVRADLSRSSQIEGFFVEIPN